MQIQQATLIQDSNADTQILIGDGTGFTAAALSGDDYDVMGYTVEQML